MKKKNYYFILVFLTLLFVPITSQSTTSKAFTQKPKHFPENAVKMLLGVMTQKNTF